MGVFSWRGGGGCLAGEGVRVFSWRGGGGV